MEKALASCMRLLVLIRETLTSLGDNNSPLLASVTHHANMCGTLIPDKERMTAEELAKLRAQIKPLKETENKPAFEPDQAGPISPADLQKRLQGGNVIVLKRRADGKIGEDTVGLPGFSGKPLT